MARFKKYSLKRSWGYVTNRQLNCNYDEDTKYVPSATNYVSSVFKKIFCT
jgi:hypothetical protein